MKLNYFTSIFMAIMITVFSTHSAKANLIPVTSIGDNLVGSLRLAVATANPGDTITFDPAIDGMVTFLTLGEITIDKALVIMGNGSLNTTISGANLSHIFNIVKADSVTILGLTLTAGATVESGGAVLIDSTKVTIDNCVVSANNASGDAATQGGGGVANVGGDLFIINNSSVSLNHATGTSGSGGGILNLGGGTITVVNSTISGNTANRAGGGIESIGAGTVVTLINATLEENFAGSAPGNGGAVHITGAGNITVEGGLVSGNTATAEGGGLWNGTG